ncbi:L-seryl-tRNA(Ser) seleniumtransferase [Cnuella takakiae]|uniref:L-seryl-tRNA(Ser) seleniumtransferase n=1 Tax=Cnuella takakiae TaxID=1302690 RepID=A0A1M5BW04_9BACT|nr:aminotransferase class V-fold PLP-dependent enzyme [Cnuella takakiae]OLY93537.1 selenocysteine synthase [Cnuella takakiae]SHF46744.1 L-seryl-tRNA(Ser) seleniumtransferase [Cnuella takakiae]
MKRRDLLRRLSLLPFAGSTVGAFFMPTAVQAAPTGAKRNLFQELGVRTFINAAGTYTFMTGSLMHDYVQEAWLEASKEFCLLDELQDKVGAKLAELTHAEAAVVTAGAFSGLTLGLAGILTGTDVEKVKKLPHIGGTGMKSEVIYQKGHEIDYNHALTNTGCTMVAVENIADVEKAINEKTAMLFFVNILANSGKISHEEWVALGRKHGIPTAIDIAADVPPVENLWKFNDMGFDFVVVSGGKAMRGPQSAGVLMGRKKIIEAARLHMPPRGFNIGRGMKVNKEEVVAMYVAIEQFIKHDHAKDYKIWGERIAHIENAVKGLPGVSTNVTTPELGNVTPTLEVSWKEDLVKMKPKDLQERLRNGQPSIEVAGGKENSVNITAWVMKAGEEKIVARRLKEELSRAAV